MKKKINGLIKPFVLLLTMFSVLSLPGLSQGSSNLTDAEIASIAVVANQIDIDYAEIALKRSKDPEVRKFAQTMIADHKGVIAQATALVKKLGVTPKDNKISKKLQADALETMKSLLKKSGDAYDKAYIQNEIAYHRAVIATVKDLLIPDTDNKELKELLQNVLPALETHLEHAIMVQNKISK